MVLTTELGFSLISARVLSILEPRAPEALVGLNLCARRLLQHTAIGCVHRRSNRLCEVRSQAVDGDVSVGRGCH